MIHAYMLMGNHYQLPVETPEANLCDGMRWFQGMFTNRYNRFNREIGHLYQGRYKPLAVDSDHPGYFQHVSSYIHLNPARARLVKDPSQSSCSFPWSRRAGLAGEGILFSHDQVAARKKSTHALKVLNLTLGELRKTPKNVDRKQVIVWYHRSKTVIDRASLSEMLCMGHPFTVSTAVTSVSQSNSKAIRE